MDEVIDAVLNHAKQGVIKVYNQYRYDAKKQKALKAWLMLAKWKINFQITREPKNTVRNEITPPVMWFWPLEEQVRQQTIYDKMW